MRPVAQLGAGGILVVYRQRGTHLAFFESGHGSGGNGIRVPVNIVLREAYVSGPVTQVNIVEVHHGGHIFLGVGNHHIGNQEVMAGNDNAIGLDFCQRNGIEGKGIGTISIGNIKIVISGIFILQVPPIMITETHLCTRSVL